jgi:hypothetical protein
MGYGLDQGGEHVEASHLRWMLACAELCRATADALLASFDTCEDLCVLCARACTECADSCERVGELQECVDACRSCAQACLAVPAIGVGQASA